jgi:hypothetical protein
MSRPLRYSLAPLIGCLLCSFWTRPPCGPNGQSKGPSLHTSSNLNPCRPANRGTAIRSSGPWRHAISAYEAPRTLFCLLNSHFHSQASGACPADGPNAPLHPPLGPTQLPRRSRPLRGADAVDPATAAPKSSRPFRAICPAPSFPVRARPVLSLDDEKKRTGAESVAALPSPFVGHTAP